MAQGGKSAEIYYAAAQKLPGAFLREKFTENGLTEDQDRANQTRLRDAKTEELLGQDSGAIDGRIERGAALASRRRSEQANKAKAKARTADTVLAAILEDIARIENDLVTQYGQGFAGDLLADLCAKGRVSDDEYAHIMAIEDNTERRCAIAIRIQEGLDNGTIKPDDLQGHPWAREWLDKHKEATTEMLRQTAQYERGEIGVDDLSRSAKNEATHASVATNPESESAAEVSKVSLEQSRDEVVIDEDQLAASIDLSALMKPV